MKHTIYAAKGLVLEGKQVKAGDILGIVETEHDVQRVVASLGNGAGTFDAPAAEPASAAAEAAPAKAKK